MQLPIRVTLPPGALVDYLDFCEAIAQAVCPTDGQGPEGIDCIAGKKVVSYVPIPPVSNPPVGNPYHAAWQAVLISEDGRTLDQLSSSDRAAQAGAGQLELSMTDPGYPCYQVGEFSGEYPLSDDERRALEALLPELPPLRYPISEDDAAAFMSAYLRLPNRLAWKPVLIPAMTIEDHKTYVKRQHQQVLQSELARGRIVSVTHDYVQVATFGAGYFIPRNQAIAYLERVGFAHSDMVTGGDRDVARPQQQEISLEPSGGQQSASTGDVRGAEGTQDQELCPEPAGDKWGAAKPKLSPKQREDLVAYHAKLVEDQVRNPTQQTMDEFGVSDSYVRQLNRDAKAKPASGPFVTPRKGK